MVKWVQGGFVQENWIGVGSYPAGGLPIRLWQIVCQRLQARAAQQGSVQRYGRGTGPLPPRDTAGMGQSRRTPSDPPAGFCSGPPRNVPPGAFPGTRRASNLVTACRASAAGKSANKATLGGKARVGVPWQLQPHLGPALCYRTPQSTDPARSPAQGSPPSRDPAAVQTLQSCFLRCYSLASLSEARWL